MLQVYKIHDIKKEKRVIMLIEDSKIANLPKQISVLSLIPLSDI